MFAETLIVATGAVAKKLEFTGSGEQDGFWNKGISACAVCDGAAPMFRNAQLAVIGGGDTAMEEAQFLTRYGAKVTLHSLFVDLHSKHKDVQFCAEPSNTFPSLYFELFAGG